MGLPAGSPAAPARVHLEDPEGPAGIWPLSAVATTGRLEIVTDLPARFGPLPGGDGDVVPGPPEIAVVLPVRSPGQDRLAGFLVEDRAGRRKRSAGSILIPEPEQ